MVPVELPPGPALHLARDGGCDTESGECQREREGSRSWSSSIQRGPYSSCRPRPLTRDRPDVPRKDPAVPAGTGGARARLRDRAEADGVVAVAARVDVFAGRGPAGLVGLGYRENRL
jgi:hypothetical protein